MMRRAGLVCWRCAALASAPLRLPRLPHNPPLPPLPQLPRPSRAPSRALQTAAGQAGSSAPEPPRDRGSEHGHDDGGPEPSMPAAQVGQGAGEAQEAQEAREVAPPARRFRPLQPGEAQEHMVSPRFMYALKLARDQGRSFKRLTRLSKGPWLLRPTEERVKELTPLIESRNRWATKKRMRQLIHRLRKWDWKLQSAWAFVGEKTASFPRFEGYKLVPVSDLLEIGSVEGMRNAWFSQSAEERRRLWPNTIITIMVHHPDRAAQVLEATIEPEDPSQWYEVPDVFSFLVRQAARLPEGRRRGALAELSGTLERLIRDKRPRYFNFPQWVVGTIIAASEPDSALALYNTLRERGHYLSENTKLHVGSRLAKDMRFRPLAFELLEELVRKDGLSVDDRRCAALATSLISLPDGWEEGREPPERLRTLHDLYQRILSLGFTTNQVIHASMMRTLCLNGQLDLAWNIYDFMRAEGVPTDLYVYSILLHGAKLAGSMDSTLRVVQEASVGDLQNRIVWNDLIDTVLVAANNESIAKPGRPLPVFCSMLHIYAKFFTLESLQRLIPEDLSTLLTAPALRGLEDCEWGPKLAMLLDKLPVSEPSNRVTPHADTLNIMLLGYLRSFPVAQPILDFYSHFRSLLRRGDRLAISILQEGTVPYDGVIQAVSRFPGMLNVAVDIVAGMIEDAAASAAALKEQRTLPPSDKAEGSSSPFVHPRPSVHTWSILLQAFAKMKGVQEGWRILEIMRKHGVKPNRVTWNMLIDASARSHDAKLTMEAFTHLEKEGYVPDTYTMRGLSRLVDNEDALNRLDQLMEQSESIKSTQAAPDKTQELISQWNNARAAKVLARRPRKKQLTPRPRRRRLRERPQEMPAGESESGDQAEQKDSWAGTPLVLDKTDKAGEKPRRRKKSKGEQATLPTPRTRDQASVDSYRQLYKELLPGVTHGAPQDSQKGEEGTTPGRGEAEEDREGRAAGEATTSSTPLG